MMFIDRMLPTAESPTPYHTMSPLPQEILSFAHAPGKIVLIRRDTVLNGGVGGAPLTPLALAQLVLPQRQQPMRMLGRKCLAPARPMTGSRSTYERGGTRSMAFLGNQAALVGAMAHCNRHRHNED